MADGPFISVIIPHLNETETLARCLKAILGQETGGRRFEVIVVDNGSTEPPHLLCKAVGVTLAQQPVPGPGPARNLGATIARAPLLAFIDADCLAQPGWLAAYDARFRADPGLDFLGGAIGIEPEQAGSLTDIEAYESAFSYRNRLYIEKYGFSATGNMAVRANVFREVGPFGGIATMEDTEWGQRATKLGYRCAYVAGAKVLTPSCKSFAEIARRWERHVSHEFGEVSGQPRKLVAWYLKAAIMPISPLFDLPSLLTTTSLRGPQARWRAFRYLTKVRIHRARLMMKLAMRDNSAERVSTWNRLNS